MEYIVRIGRPEDAQGYRYESAGKDGMTSDVSQAPTYSNWGEADRAARLYTFGHAVPKLNVGDLVWVMRTNGGYVMAMVRTMGHNGSRAFTVWEEQAPVNTIDDSQGQCSEHTTKIKGKWVDVRFLHAA